MPPVLYEKRDRIAYVTINRPEAKNAIDPETHELLCETWADFRDDEAVGRALGVSDRERDRPHGRVGGGDLVRDG